MQYIYNHKIFTVIFVVGVIIALIILVNILVIKYSGTPVDAPEIPREKITIGSGEKLNYAVLGDSTSISQGSDYSDGYVVGTANKLAENREVTYKNFGVSGARVNDVIEDQIPKIGDFKPDLALVGIGANDVTHFTDLQDIEKGTILIIDKLREINPDVKIVLTGSAAMGSVARFPQPTKAIMGWRARKVNEVMERIAKDKNVTFAYVARETGKAFADHPEYFAQDNFHPNAEGYAVWTPVLNNAIEQSLKTVK